jgi:hypothetical protein
MFKKMYQLLLTKKRKGNFCVKKKNYNNIPIQVPIPAQAWFVVQLQHTRLVALCILRAKRRDIYSLIVWEGS